MSTLGFTPTAAADCRSEFGFNWLGRKIGQLSRPGRLAWYWSVRLLPSVKVSVIRLMQRVPEHAMTEQMPHRTSSRGGVARG